jgi:hypothetical protein
MIHTLDLFTIVLNGMPFLPRQYEIFSQLNVDWNWHIVEGAAKLLADTARPAWRHARLPKNFHTAAGLSTDGTTDWLDQTAKEDHRLWIYRNPEGFWPGKTAMCNAILQRLQYECVLMQVDADEFWSAQQIETVIRTMNDGRHPSALWFWCEFFVGPRIRLINRNGYGNNSRFEWLRVWRFAPGMSFRRHEPPILRDGTTGDVGRLNPLLHGDTEALGLVFRHEAYTLEQQVAFKEAYYGYSGALDGWRRLQENQTWPTEASRFLPWIPRGIMAERV